MSPPHKSFGKIEVMPNYLKDLLSDSDLKKQVAWKTTKYAPGEIIIKKDAKSENLYLILSGDVSVTTDIALDASHELSAGVAKLHKDELFGELSMFDNLPHDANVVAGDDCAVGVIESSQLIDYLDQNPERGYKVMREIVMLLVKRMRQNNIRSSSILGWYWRENSD